MSMGHRREFLVAGAATVRGAVVERVTEVAVIVVTAAVAVVVVKQL